MSDLGSMTEVVQGLLRPHLKAGDWAIDATLGNGHDAAFLCDALDEVDALDGDAALVEQDLGPRVIGFDVQQEAIDASRARLGDRVIYVHAGHEDMSEHVPAEAVGAVAVVMFNLGYLPGADHARTTQEKSTLQALEASCGVLQSGGVIAVTCYRGHPGGLEEATAVEAWASALPRKEWAVLKLEHTNTKRPGPFSLLIQRELPRPSKGA